MFAGTPHETGKMNRSHEHIQSRRLMVAEDEYYIAREMLSVLQDMGATVVGPVATVQDALGLIGKGIDVDAALLDINLRGEMSFAVADALSARDVPYVFISGYGRASIPKRFAEIRHFEKPADTVRIARTLFDISANGTGTFSQGSPRSL
jgi:CheY-like chemotaxis protein